MARVMKSLAIGKYALAILLALVIPAFALDSDNDGLDDLVETNTGIYIDQFDTGTDPLNPDTDFDGVLDGQEVNSGAHPLDPTITPTLWKNGNETVITLAGGVAPDWRLLSIVWAGSEYGISWIDRATSWPPELYFSRISAAGTKIGADERITFSETAGRPSSLVWTGSEYGVSWEDYRDGNYEIYFTRISASGTKIGSDVRITNANGYSEHPSLVWTGTEYGVSWHDDRNGNEEIYFSRISASGIKIGSDVRITNAANASRFSSLVWTGTEYGVSWADNRDGKNEIYFARISVLGSKIGSDVRITYNPSPYPFPSNFPSLAWTGTEYGVSWQDARDGVWGIYFTRISATGAKIGADKKISEGKVPSLVWTGRDYGIIRGNFNISFTHITATGTQIGPHLAIRANDSCSDYPILVWTGTEFGVTWGESNCRLSPTPNAFEIYFTRIAVDEDGDGLSHADELNVYGTDPYNYDTDGDGIPDASPTPVGDNISLTLSGGVSISFTSVIDNGITVATKKDSGPPLDGNFKLGTPPTYYSIITTATYSGPIEVCIAYDESAFKKPEKNLRLFHFDAQGKPRDITTSLDTDANLICGEVMGFSTFVLAVENPAIVQKERPTIGGCAIKTGKSSPSIDPLLLLPFVLGWVLYNRKRIRQKISQ